MAAVLLSKPLLQLTSESILHDICSVEHWIFGAMSPVLPMRALWRDDVDILIISKGHL